MRTLFNKALNSIKAYQILNKYNLRIVNILYFLSFGYLLKNLNYSTIFIAPEPISSINPIVKIVKKIIAIENPNALTW